MSHPRGTVMATIAYLRVSTDQQKTDSQKHAISDTYKIEKWFSDNGVSGAVKAVDRAGLSDLIKFVREGDTVVVSAIDRLGRNTLDVLNTVELLKDKGVSLISIREGFDLSTPIGQAMLTMLSAVAQLERDNIKSRQMAGIEKARSEGKALGRKKTIDDQQVIKWRTDNKASIKATAEHFSISTASVKRAYSRHND